MHAMPTDVSTASVSRETSSRLDAYAAVLLKWNAKINLIGPATQADLRTRHLEDSAQILPLIPPQAETLVDLGSGAGLPGIVIAISRPDLAVTLVERDQRKAAFLTEVKSLLALAQVTVCNADFATLSARYDVVTARALAPLSPLLAFAAPLLSDRGICLFPKGIGADHEVAQAQQSWSFQCTAHPSRTQPGSSILEITHLVRKEG